MLNYKKQKSYCVIDVSAIAIILVIMYVSFKAKTNEPDFDKLPWFFTKINLLVCFTSLGDLHTASSASNSPTTPGNNLDK